MLLVAVLAVGLFAPGWPAPVRSVLTVAGAVATAAGLVLAVAGMWHLGPSLTPFPAPVEGGRLREGGVYGLVRHPIYGGVWLGAAGWSLWTSPWALVPTLLLGVLFEGKRRREEVWLAERYPDYAAYRAKVRHRFISFLV